jgi:hypothetical protein
MGKQDIRKSEQWQRFIDAACDNFPTITEAPSTYRVLGLRTGLSRSGSSSVSVETVSPSSMPRKRARAPSPTDRNPPDPSR